MPLSVQQKLKLINWWPPYLGAGIRVTRVADDFSSIEVELKLRFWNRNLYGTAFGGSLYSMADPFYAIICAECLGKDYIVWDKSARIEYVSPGDTDVHALFEIPLQRIEQIREELETLGKNTYHFATEIRNVKGQIVARVEKEVYLRKKQR